MSRASDPDLLVLHALRVGTVTAVPALADRVDLSATEVEGHLERLAADGQGRWCDGRVSGWTLTTVGRQVASDRVVAEVEESGARSTIADAYDRFRAHNDVFLEVCADWQLRPIGAGVQRVPNTHDDARYDAGVVARLLAVHDAVVPVCRTLAGALDRFGRYERRFAMARRRVEAGAGEWVASPRVDSFHTVWFELHEDLLVSLGLERSGSV